MAQSAMTERCYRSALWGSLRESQLPQHLSVALRAPPPLKGRLCAAARTGRWEIDPYRPQSLASLAKAGRALTMVSRATQ